MKGRDCNAMLQVSWMYVRRDIACNSRQHRNSYFHPYDQSYHGDLEASTPTADIVGARLRSHLVVAPVAVRTLVSLSLGPSERSHRWGLGVGWYATTSRACQCMRRRHLKRSVLAGEERLRSCVPDCGARAYRPCHSCYCQPASSLGVCVRHLPRCKQAFCYVCAEADVGGTS